MTSFKYCGAILSKDGTSTAEVQIRIVNGNRIDGQTEQVVDKQLYQLSHQEHALQEPRSLHPTLRLRDLNASRRHIPQDTGN